MIKLRYSIFNTRKVHFSGFKNRSLSFSHWRTLRISLSCSFMLLVNIRMSSIYTTTCPSSIMSEKILFIIAWKVTWELVNLKNMTVGSNSPLFILKAAFHSSPSLILTLLYPHRTSNFEKIFAPFSLSINSGINGSGY